MKILFISLLLLTLVGCAHSNFDWHQAALSYNDSKALAGQNRQQYPADLNPQQRNFPHLYPYTYTILKWWTASERGFHGGDRGGRHWRSWSYKRSTLGRIWTKSFSLSNRNPQPSEYLKLQISRCYSYPSSSALPSSNQVSKSII
jgi:hypothetical protein